MILLSLVKVCISLSDTLRSHDEVVAVFIVPKNLFASMMASSVVTGLFGLNVSSSYPLIRFHATAAQING